MSCRPLACCLGIDNHAHPSQLLAPGEKDADADALPPDAISDLALPTPMLEGSPLLPEAWRAMFQLKASGAMSQTQSDALHRKREHLQKSKGDGYPAWVLNQTDTVVMLANGVAMGRGLTGDRFKWVPFVSHQLESWKASGAVALKFELAYLRDLKIGDPTRESADRVYAIYSQSSEPTADEYRILQDYLFRSISTEAGRLCLSIHIHSSLGAGSYFVSSNANPLELEGISNDPALRRTKFVLLHGAWPFAKEAAMLILKPNVYLDISALYFLTYPAQASKGLRLYLESAPEKVLYGHMALHDNAHGLYGF